MALQLGKIFDRNYNLRLPFLDSHYDVGIFCNRKSPFSLFSINPEREDNTRLNNAKILMFKNLSSSKFCETFINLHSYRNDNLEISNQFNGIKEDYNLHINFLLNETINFSKINIDPPSDKILYDSLMIYGLTFSANFNEFIFLIVERHNIIQRLKKKVVKTIGIQIATSNTLEILDKYHADHVQMKLKELK